MVLESELLELMRRLDEFPFEDGKLALKENHGHRVMVKDSKKGYVVGEAVYRNKDFYHIKTDDGRMTLFYFNLERIFINGQED